MLDGPTLRFGGLLGPGICQLVGSGVATPDLIYLSICSGEAPCFRVICGEERLLAGATDRLQRSGSTNVVHGRHLETLGCSRCTGQPAKNWYVVNVDLVGVVSGGGK